jgi:hypothetical protein
MTQPRRPRVPPDHALVQAHDTGGPSDPARTVTLTGLFKKVDDSRHRVYLTRDLSSYAEYDVSDFLGSEKVDADKSPIPGEDADRVTLKRGARVSFVHSVRASVTADNQSDLDVRTGAPTYHPDGGITTVTPITTKVCKRTIIEIERRYGYGYCQAETKVSTLPCWITVLTRTI